VGILISTKLAFFVAHLKFLGMAFGDGKNEFKILPFCAVLAIFFLWLGQSFLMNLSRIVIKRVRRQHVFQQTLLRSFNSG